MLAAPSFVSFGPYSSSSFHPAADDRFSALSSHLLLRCVPPSLHLHLRSLHRMLAWHDVVSVLRSMLFISLSPSSSCAIAISPFLSASEPGSLGPPSPIPCPSFSSSPRPFDPSPAVCVFYFILFSFCGFRCLQASLEIFRTVVPRKCNICHRTAFSSGFPKSN